MNFYISPKYALEITNLAFIIALKTERENHRLTFGLTSNFSQIP